MDEPIHLTYITAVEHRAPALLRIPRGPTLSFSGQPGYGDSMRDGSLSGSWRLAITILISAIVLATLASAQSTEKVLSKFPGASPQGLLNWDAQGHLYGNLATGTNVTRTGTVFELKQGSKGLWSKKVLYKFTGASDGGWPNGGMIFDGTGNLYGTGAAGGDVGDGVVFELVSGPN